MNKENYKKTLGWVLAYGFRFFDLIMETMAADKKAWH